MNLTHIFLAISINARKTAYTLDVAVFDKSGKLVTGTPITMAWPNSPTRGQSLYVDVHEAIVRIVTRTCLDVDVSMRTPILISGA